LNNNSPVVLVMGGGTGAEGINNLIKESVGELVKFCQIAHLTGQGKNPEINPPAGGENYQAFEFLEHDKTLEIMAAADLVIARAGIGTLSELANLSKPAIIIPMPNSHQEKNAAMLLEKNAAIVLKQKNLTGDSFVAAIKFLLDNQAERKNLGNNIEKLFKEGANEEIKNIIVTLLHC
jgi:UDP-N-acetylglucosamine--N-acetylmuramyl-(pentapeptide) pyrophosphoryl-undecaprenol N-acetylglucosamine transferase